MIVGVELVIALAAVGGVIATSISQVIAWRRNGSHQTARDRTHAEAQAVRDATITSNQKAILGRLGHLESGLASVTVKMADMQTDYARVSSTFAEQIKGHDRDIKELRERPRTP